MKKLLFTFTMVLCSLFLTGCAGTRFTEMLWAVGTEEDYLVFPENQANILYQYCNDYYIKCFNEQVLDNLNCYQVYEELYTLADSAGLAHYDICLVCYEKPEDFCFSLASAIALLKFSVVL